MPPTMNIAQEIYLAIMIPFLLSGKLLIIMSLVFRSSIMINIITEERVINKQLIGNSIPSPGSNKKNIKGIIRYTGHIPRKKNKSLYTS